MFITLHNHFINNSLQTCMKKVLDSSRTFFVYYSLQVVIKLRAGKLFFNW